MARTTLRGMILARIPRFMSLVTILALLITLGPSHANTRLAFHVAVRKGDLATVKRLIAAGQDPRELDLNGSNAAHYAARGGQVETLRMLLDLGVPADLVDKQGRRPLYEAAAADSAECCKLLLERGADLNATTVGGWSPLYAALVWGKSESACFLIRAGAKNHASMDTNGASSLLIASRRGPLQTVKALIETNESLMATDFRGRTALHYGAESRDSEIVSYLLSLGLDPNLEDSQGLTALELAINSGSYESGRPLIGVSKNLQTVLGSVISSAPPELVREFLDSGCEIEASSLALAAGHKCQRRDLARFQDQHALEIVQLLVGRKPSELEERGTSALMRAIRWGNVTTAQNLLDWEVESNLPGPNGSRALHLAVERGYLDLVERLLFRGADPQAKDATGLSALERLNLRTAKLSEELRPLRRMRCLHPRERTIRSELKRLRAAKPILLQLLSRFEFQISG